VPQKVSPLFRFAEMDDYILAHVLLILPAGKLDADSSGSDSASFNGRDL
jgi:hypothetical protein